MKGHSFTYGALYINRAEQSQVWLLKGFFFSFQIDCSSVAEEMTACAVTSVTPFVMVLY